MASKVQVNINGKAEELWKLVPRMSKALVIEQGLLKLAEDDKLSSVFFGDLNAVKEILGNHISNTKPQKEKEPLAPKDSDANVKKISDKKEIETAW